MVSFSLRTALIAVLAIGGNGALAEESGAGNENVLFKEIARANNQTLMWGPYRPNLYFGVRPRLPKSLMSGLMWSKVEDWADVQNSKSNNFWLKWQEIVERKG
jgi:mannosyl-oligosaccharide glucosidase